MEIIKTEPYYALLYFVLIDYIFPFCFLAVCLGGKVSLDLE
jgi:hypothetical protein